MKHILAVAVPLLASLAFVLLLWASLWSIAGSQTSVNLPELLAGKMHESGVDHPVTAVLLNFRSYDTLLEIAVLVIAGITGISMAKTASLEDPDLRTSDSLLYVLQRWFIPLMLVLAGYLLWAGSDRPGGVLPGRSRARGLRGADAPGRHSPGVPPPRSAAEAGAWPRICRLPAGGRAQRHGR